MSEHINIFKDTSKLTKKASTQVNEGMGLQCSYILDRRGWSNLKDILKSIAYKST